MGGFGSGRRERFSKDTCETYKRVDLRFMRKKGWLRTGGEGTLSWTLRGEPNGSIQYRVEAEALVLEYKHRHGEHAWTQVKQLIGLVALPQHFGGSRLVMECPSCSRRCLVLYGGARFRCRTCQNLTYTCQNETPMFRTLYQAQKYRVKLGGPATIDEWFPPKPKRMHWTTYRAIKAKSLRLERMANQLAAVRFGEFL